MIRYLRGKQVEGQSGGRLNDEATYFLLFDGMNQGDGIWENGKDCIVGFGHSLLHQKIACLQ